jgi:hypothetical protein
MRPDNHRADLDHPETPTASTSAIGDVERRAPVLPPDRQQGRRQNRRKQQQADEGERTIDERLD